MLVVLVQPCPHPTLLSILFKTLVTSPVTRLLAPLTALTCMVPTLASYLHVTLVLDSIESLPPQGLLTVACTPPCSFPCPRHHHQWPNDPVVSLVWLPHPAPHLGGQWRRSSWTSSMTALVPESVHAAGQQWIHISRCTFTHS
ncbi:hypothetical protein BJV78DRAFT_1197538 [Lactifluus subvellereus]|nr:hypothetical protein BJV78DRAFT_1197538 [Lactifluus subvellereus]